MSHLLLSHVQVLQFALNAVKAEAFNPSTLFLFGSYTIGKERLFLEVARALERKVCCPLSHLHCTKECQWYLTCVMCNV
jgi:DNA cross-link repair 1A protein